MDHYNVLANIFLYDKKFIIYSIKYYVEIKIICEIWFVKKTFRGINIAPIPFEITWV